jgi:hypothetical protein
MKHLPALLLAIATGPSLQAQEILKFKEPAKNPPIEGKIVTLTHKTIEIETAGVKQPIDARRVAEIVPVAKTPDYLKGEEAMANGNFAVASERFERVATDARAPESVRQLASIQIGRCAAANGDHAGVVQAAQVLRARKADSFFAGESFALEVKSHIALGNGAGAAGALRAFAAIAPGEPELEFLEAAFAESQADWKGALATYRKYLRDPVHGVTAALGEMRTLTAKPDWPALGAVAEAHLKNAMGRRDYSPRILIAAYTAKGDVDANAGKVRDALLHYLQGALVQNRGETSPEHEAAIARSSLVCVKLFSAEKDAPRKARYRSQAKEMHADLLKYYPRSRFRSDVEKGLQELR